MNVVNQRTHFETCALFPFIKIGRPNVKIDNMHGPSDNSKDERILVSLLAIMMLNAYMSESNCKKLNVCKFHYQNHYLFNVHVIKGFARPVCRAKTQRLIKLCHSQFKLDLSEF